MLSQASGLFEKCSIKFSWLNGLILLKASSSANMVLVSHGRTLGFSMFVSIVLLPPKENARSSGSNNPSADRTDSEM